MGVLSCCRPECTSIMCNTYHPSHGYICSECQEEYKLAAGLVHDTDVTNAQIEESLADFLKTDKGEYCSSVNYKNIDSYFNELKQGI